MQNTCHKIICIVYRTCLVVVMQKCCLRRSKESREMCNKHLMHDACLNNVNKTCPVNKAIVCSFWPY